MAKALISWKKRIISRAISSFQRQVPSVPAPDRIRISFRYHLIHLRQETRYRIQDFLHRRLGLYVAYARPSNAGIKLFYNQGKPVALSDVAALSRANDARSYVFHVPVEKCVWGYGWRYASRENPFSRFFEDETILERFYEAYRPDHLQDALTLERSLPREVPSVSFAMQLVQPIMPTPWKGKCGLGPRHGCNLSGPVSKELVFLEEQRLRHVLTSISRHGWKPNGFAGHMNGLFLVYGDDFVFRVSSGCHRAAALSYMGWSSLPVVFHPLEPRVVIGDGQEDEELLRFYFDASLRQKRLAFLDGLQ